MAATWRRDRSCKPLRSSCWNRDQTFACQEARLARRDERRDDPRAQAQSADATDRVGMGVGPLEDRPVVELGIARQAELAPVLDQAFDHELRRHAGLDGPRRDQAAVQRDGVEHLDLRAALDDQPLDDVEAVEFVTPGRDLRQIPSQRWGWPAHPLLAVEETPPPQDAVDGPHRRGATRSPGLAGPDG